MATDSNNIWLRPLKKFENFLEICHKNGNMLTSYCLTLNADQPLQEKNVKTALVHLQRKVPTLRACIRQKIDGEFWFCEMDSEKVDFQVLDYEKVEEEYVGMTKHQYKSADGPLWCARLFKAPETEPCPMLDIKSAFPFQYQLIFGFHHIITDGSSSMKICGFFLDLLNDVIEERDIDDKVQLAYHDNGDRDEKIYVETAMQLLTNPAELEKYSKIATNVGIEILFLKAYPPPSDQSSHTLNLPYDFGNEDTSKLLKVCKEKGVSFHSAFCTAANLALIAMIRTKGFQQEEFEIPTRHISNNRRYWNGEVSKAFGPYIGTFIIISKYSGKPIEHFWKYAQTFFSDLQLVHSEHVPYKESCALFLSLPEGADLQSLMKKFKLSSCYYTTTNMGNVASSLSGEGSKVQVTHFKRTTSSDKQIWSHVLQTFRGRLLYGLDYDPSLVTKETAQLYLTTIFQILRSAITI